MEVELRVRRYDPSEDGRPYTQSYLVEATPADTVLDVLLKVADEQDPSLAFRRMCISGICGTCGLDVDGKLVLGCQQPVTGGPKEDGVAPSGPAVVEVGPMPRFPVLRDLVVDMEPFFESLKGALPWLVPDPHYDGVIPAETHAVMTEAATCVLCGLCAADQPSPGNAAGPAAWVKGYRFSQDPRDLLGQTRLQMLADLGLTSQAAVSALARVCPKNIFIGGALVVDEQDDRKIAGGE